MIRRKKPMKRTWLRSSSSSRRRRRGVAKINHARQQKRRKEYAAKLAKARRGTGYADAMERAGGRCEYVYPVYDRDGPGNASPVDERCPVTDGLEAHHLHYSLRFGGNELASDYLVLCKAHHAYIEQQQFPHRQHRRKSA